MTDNPAPIHELVLRLKHLQSRWHLCRTGQPRYLLPRSKEKVQAALSSIGIHVLWNEIAYPLGQELPLVGLADWSHEFKIAPVMSQLDAETPRIVLSHNPDTAKLLKQWRVDLQAQAPMAVSL